MASTKEFLNYITERLGLPELSYRPMMGEFVLYYQRTVVGGIYDNRLLLKPSKSALALLSEGQQSPQFEIPYEGAKPMLAADAEDQITPELIRRIAADLKKK